MTLTRLLEINSRLLKPEEISSIAVAERLWRGLGCPTDAHELIDLLERVLLECGRYGIRYAPIFLQRKKALHRGTWSPQVCGVLVEGGTNESSSQGGACSRCGGTGYMLVDGGRSATLCSCGKWGRQQKAG